MRIWNFQGYQRNSMWNLQGLIKNKVEFRWMTKKKSCEISRGFGFWAWNFQGWSSFLHWISWGKVKKRKLPGDFSKKYVLNRMQQFTRYIEWSSQWDHIIFILYIRITHDIWIRCMSGENAFFCCWNTLLGYSRRGI